MRSFSRNILIAVLFVSATFLFSACLKRNNFPNTPEIKYVDYIEDGYVTVKNGVTSYNDKLIFTFVDGDGDVGLNDWDTLPPFDASSIYNSNLFMKLFEKKDGEFVEKIFTDLKFNYRFPYLTPQGQNKSLEATVEVKMVPILLLPANDTIRFEVYMVDRALNKSNVITTREIVID